MANRRRCLMCRGYAHRIHLTDPGLHRLLCPEHKRLRNRMLRAAAGSEKGETT